MRLTFNGTPDTEAQINNAAEVAWAAGYGLRSNQGPRHLSYVRSPLESPAALSRSERPRRVGHTAGRTDALVICR